MTAKHVRSTTVTVTDTSAREFRVAEILATARAVLDTDGAVVGIHDVGIAIVGDAAFLNHWHPVAAVAMIEQYLMLAPERVVGRAWIGARKLMASWATCLHENEIQTAEAA